jgi:hypothetical protein
MVFITAPNEMCEKKMIFKFYVMVAVRAAHPAICYRQVDASDYYEF